MKTNIFTHELTESSSVFGRKHDIAVVFSGDQPATDGSTIYLPALGQNEDMTEEQVRVTRGFVDHEAGHVRHTSFGVVRRVNSDARKAGNKLMPILVNALEDVRLERRVMEEYPGALKNFRSMAAAINQVYLDQYEMGMNLDEESMRKRVKNKAWIGPFAITWAGRLDYGEDSSRGCLETLSDPAFQEQCIEWAEAAAACKNTSQIAKLAKEIEPFLREPGEEEPQGEEPQDGLEPGDDGEPGEPGEGEEKGEGEEEGEGEDEDKGTGTGHDDSDTYTNEDGEYEETGTTTETKGGGVGASRSKEAFVVDPEKEIEPLDPDAGQATGKVLKDLTSTYGSYRPYTLNDKVHTRHDDYKKHDKNGAFGLGAHYLNAPHGPKEYQDTLDSMRSETAVMRRRLERTLLAQQNRDWNPAQETGRLDSRRLGSVLTGNVHVFKTRTDVPDMDTAVTILCDLSGSMAGTRAELTQQMVISLALIMERVNVSFEVLGFNSRTGQVTRKRRHRGATRTEPIDYYVFKSYDENIWQAKGALGFMKRCAGGMNCDGEAVLWAYHRLAKRLEKRRILMVLSDGQPAATLNGASANWHLREVVKFVAEKKDVEFLGIGIQSSAVKRYYPRYVVVNNLNDLAGEAIDQLGQLLLGNDRYTSRVAV